MQEHETCAGCRFFTSFDRDSRPEMLYFGKCRRRAPVAVAVRTEDGFPRVCSDDWCGDFEASGQKQDGDGQPAKVEGAEAVQRHLTALRGQR